MLSEKLNFSKHFSVSKVAHKSFGFGLQLAFLMVNKNEILQPSLDYESQFIT